MLDGDGNDYNLVEYEKEQLRKILKRGCVFQVSRKRVMNRYRRGEKCTSGKWTPNFS